MATVEEATKALNEYVNKRKDQVITAEENEKAFVQARLAKEGEVIESINKNGVTEGVRTIQPNEKIYVLTRCNENGEAILNKDGKSNVWTNSAEKFAKNYSLDEKTGIAVAIPEQRHFLVADYDMQVPCSWSDNGLQNVSKGDYIRIDEGNQYAIGRQEFEETHVITDRGTAHRKFEEEMAIKKKESFKNLDKQEKSFSFEPFKFKRGRTPSLSVKEVPDKSLKHNKGFANGME